MRGRTRGLVLISSSVLAITILASCAGRSEKSSAPPSPPSSQYEREFLQNRIAHQQAALEMAQACVEKAQRNELKQFCSTLIGTEGAESKQLESWLGQWYSVSPAKGAQERATEGYQNFLKSVRNAVGADFENVFLMALRLHHREGIRESRECQGQAVHSELRSQCGTMVEEQTRELKQMSGWICEWFKDCVER